MNNLILLQVAANVNDAKKPAMYIECLAHAREWITGSVCLGSIDIVRILKIIVIKDNDSLNMDKRKAFIQICTFYHINNIDSVPLWGLLKNHVNGRN